jgi:hypothetical protein
MNEKYEQEYDEALKEWGKAAVNLRPLDKRVEQAIKNGTIYYLTSDDGLLLQQEREASTQLNNARKKYFVTDAKNT